MHLARRFFCCRTRPSGKRIVGKPCGRHGVTAARSNGVTACRRNGVTWLCTQIFPPSSRRRFAMPEFSYCRHAVPRRAEEASATTPIRRYADTPTTSIDIRLFPVLGDVEAGSLNFGIGSQAQKCFQDEANNRGPDDRQNKGDDDGFDL